MYLEKGPISIYNKALKIEDFDYINYDEHKLLITYTHKQKIIIFNESDINKEFNFENLESRYKLSLKYVYNNIEDFFKSYNMSNPGYKIEKVKILNVYNNILTLEIYRYETLYEFNKRIGDIKQSVKIKQDKFNKLYWESVERIKSLK